MKDALKQYIQLRKALVEEKAEIESRLERIDQALGSTKKVGAPAPAMPEPVAKPGKPGAKTAKPIVTRRGRGGNPLSLKAAILQVTETKALTKPEILDAIAQLGYRFKTDKPMGSLNAVLYSKKQFVNVGGRFRAA